MFSSSPTGGSESMQLMYLLAITAAQRTIRPVERLFRAGRAGACDALVDALQARRARCRSSRPGEHIDAETVRSASRATWGELLAAGAEIYEYQPTMYHCKVMIVDELLVSVGSTNFDNRSFRLNDEANLNIYDAEFARAAGRDLRGRPARTRAASRSPSGSERPLARDAWPSRRRR